MKKCKSCSVLEIKNSSLVSTYLLDPKKKVTRIIPISWKISVAVEIQLTWAPILSYLLNISVVCLSSLKLHPKVKWMSATHLCIASLL